MANWISSKLKVAENLLQQIDQQAAESLRKGEIKQLDGLDVITSPKSSGALSLRDQLKKKPSNVNENLGKLSKDNANSSEVKLTSDGISRGESKDKKGKDVTKRDNSSSESIVNDSDWTKLLNTPIQQPIASRKNSGNGVRKDGGKMELDLKGNGKVGGRTVRKGGYGKGEKVSRVVGDGGAGSSVGSSGKKVEEVDSEVAASLQLEKVDGDAEMGYQRDRTDEKSAVKGDLQSVGNSEGVYGVVSEEGKRDVCNDEIIGDATLRMNRSNAEISNSVIGGLKSASRSGSDHESDSGSSSSSDSGAEQEREEKRQRRRQILAAKAAAKAVEAIKEQENVVARLEGEKQSLEKILEELANQAAQEASELQSMMMETMEATDVEKQKHNHTRMEVLARLAKLETANADLTKCLATAQWNLEIEVNRLAELRCQVEAKEVALEDLKRNISSAHQARETLSSLMSSKGFELQKEMLEAECAFAVDKIARLQEKGMKLEANIEMTSKETENSTEVEVELRRRLRQMTDHLIHKQAQVESLSSDKATLLFRIEAVSRLLDENKSLSNGGEISGCSREDLESASWQYTGSKLRPILEYKIQSGRQHLGSLLRQLDAIFSAGAIFLARNPAAKLWSLVYLVALHLWVLYILFSHSRSTEDSTSNSVLSLENINGSGV